MTLNLLYSTVAIKTGQDGKKSFVLYNPRSQKTISFYRSGMSKLIEELFRAREVLNESKGGDGIVYHGIVGGYKNFVYAVTGNIYQNRKFIWCRLFVKNDPSEPFAGNMTDDLNSKSGIYIKEFDAYATKIAVMFSMHDPFNKLLDLILTTPMDSMMPANASVDSMTPEMDGSSPSAPGFVKSELNQPDAKRMKTVDTPDSI